MRLAKTPLLAALMAVLCLAGAARAGGPITPPGLGVANQASADGVSSFTFTASEKLLLSLSVKIGATSGYVMVLDGAALPSDGAVSPVWCSARIVSDGTSGAVSVEWAHPLRMTNGITIAFSTTGCDTLTASATAKFMGQAL